MDYQQVIKEMDRDTYERLKKSLETGRWPDGKVLSDEQRTHTMRAVIAYGEMNLPVTERVGYIDKGSKEGQTCDSPEDDQNNEQPLKWR